MNKLFALFSLTLVSMSAHSAVVTIDFEEHAGSVVSLQQILANTDVSNGFLMSPGLGTPVWLNNFGPPSINVAMSSTATSIVFDRSDSLTFDLLDFDYDAGANGNYSLSISGTKYGGGVVSANLNWQELAITEWLNFSDTGIFTNLTSLTIETTGGTGTGIVVDNFRVNIVPIPGAVWLLGSALMGLGWLRRKPR